MTLLNDDLNKLSADIERLVIENRLLRKASQEQRELNGSLREEYNELRNDYNSIIKDSFTSLTNWNNWFDVWAIMLDGTCYDDAYEFYCQARDVTEVLEGAIDV